MGQSLYMHWVVSVHFWAEGSRVAREGDSGICVVQGVGTNADFTRGNM